jgi:hypothetical protein
MITTITSFNDNKLFEAGAFLGRSRLRLSHVESEAGETTISSSINPGHLNNLVVIYQLSCYTTNTNLPVVTIRYDNDIVWSMMLPVIDDTNNINSLIIEDLRLPPQRGAIVTVTLNVNGADSALNISYVAGP